MLVRPRGHSKTGDIGALIVHALVCGRPGQQIYSAAAGRDQADLLLTDVVDKFRRNPRLAHLIRTTQHSVGDVGQRVRNESRDRG